MDHSLCFNPCRIGALTSDSKEVGELIERVVSFVAKLGALGSWPTWLLKLTGIYNSWIKVIINMADKLKIYLDISRKNDDWWGYFKHFFLKNMQINLEGISATGVTPFFQCP